MVNGGAARNDYIEAFIGDAYGNIGALSRCLPEYISSQGGAAPIYAMYRSAHTLKASAQALGFMGIAGLAHEMEDVINETREGRILPGVYLYDYLYGCLKCFSDAVSNISKYGAEGEPGFSRVMEMGAGLKKESVRGVDPTECVRGVDLAKCVHAAYAPSYAGFPDSGDKGERIYRLRFVIARGCLMKAARAYAIIKKLEKNGRIIQTRPGLADIEEERFDSELEVIFLCGRGLEYLQNLAAGFSDMECFDITEISPEGDSPAGDSPEDDSPAGDSPADDSPASDICEGVTFADGVFAALRRVCEVMSSELGKPAELIVRGDETERCAGFIKGLTQSLIHIIRNCVDHGIETPGQRAAAGKPAVGRISLKAFCDGTDAVLEIADDGAGVDLKKVRDTALASGILEEKDTLVISGNELVNLVFLPSFTTRSRASVYSGRGMGLDAVKTQIEELGGSAKIETEEGMGTKIILRAPYANVNLPQEVKTGLGARPAYG